MPQKSAIIKCQKCGLVSNIISDTCMKCGSRLEKVCGECGFSSSVEKNHCDQCGALLALRPEPPAASGPGPDAVPPPPPSGAPPEKPKFQFELRPISDTVSEKEISYRTRKAGKPTTMPVSPDTTAALVSDSTNGQPFDCR